MKKQILKIALLMSVFLSCKKDQAETQLTNETEKQSESYYPVGTELELNSSSIVSGKTSYINQSPYLPGLHQEAALGTYNKGTLIAKSLNSVYSLYYQLDGNLVLTNGSTVLWAANENYFSSATVKFQHDGNIVCHRWDGSIYWSAGVNGGTQSIWVVQDDGNLVGYEAWTSGYPSKVVSTGPPFASTNTAGGNVSSYFGRVRIL
ncbi:hypothetical protein [Pedobacter sp. SL55]|uniref:hypothetical protein n=1 Tax=Pedobacter sp. SL55 TaxID=2995161 RepID=UPI00226E34A4|nr:hypothetical protein [Pedobacter sp. SL55]WAC42298.1 hypothetical protein OVA16_08070 [Pedobacter sp. SL55]